MILLGRLLTAAAAAAAALFALGIVVANLYLDRYGLHEFGGFRPRDVAVGTLFAAVAAVPFIGGIAIGESWCLELASNRAGRTWKVPWMTRARSVVFDAFATIALAIVAAIAFSLLGELALQFPSVQRIGVDPDGRG